MTTTKTQTQTSEEKGVQLIHTDHGEIRLSPNIVKKLLVSGDASKVTDQEVTTFIALCKYQNLNPFIREAYLIKFGTEPATIVVGKEAFTKRADKNPAYDGEKAGVIALNDKGEVVYREGSLVLPKETLVGGWAEVKRKDREFLFRVEVSFDEYCRKTREGKPMAQWAKMPATMIRKVALVQALREAFPKDFAGMFAVEEMNIDAASLSDKPIDIPVDDYAVQQEQPDYTGTPFENTDIK